MPGLAGSPGFDLPKSFPNDKIRKWIYVANLNTVGLGMIVTKCLGICGMNTNAAKSKNYKEYYELNKAPEIQGWLIIRFKRWEFTSISLTRAPIFLITSSEGIATWLNSLEYYPISLTHHSY